MNNLSKLIKSKVISFNELIVEAYKPLGLDEQDVLILIHLHNQLLNNNNVLSISYLEDKLTLTEEQISNKVLSLVQKGFLELLIGSDNQETYSLDDAYDKLGNLMDEEHSDPISRKDQIRQIVNYLEVTLQTTIKPNEVEIINAWIDEKYSFDEIKQAALDSLRMNRPTISNIDRKLVNNLSSQYSEEVDEKTFQLLNKIYVKNRI